MPPATSHSQALGQAPSSLAVAMLTASAVFLFFILNASAEELITKYASIQYDSVKQLQRLNDELFIGREMSYELRNRKIFSVQDEVAAKFDILIERVQKVLDMHIDKLQFSTRIFSSAEDAQAALFQKYKKKVNYISFYSRRENLLYLSVKHSELKVVAHEFGHVVVEHYFNRSPPVKMHEVMAQYAETHIID